MTKSRGILPPRRYWEPCELALLRSMYPDAHGEDVAAWLGRSLKQVYMAAKVHGVRKSAEYLASDAACRIQRGKQNANMIATRFQPGIVPWNTGLKGVTGTQEACRRTQFKKGEMSGAAQHNYVPIGSHRLSKDGYLERKVTDDPKLYPARRWVPVARIVWEAANGPIPASHMIIFKAGQRTAVLEQITVDRLECISRAENARRNHPRSRSPELARLVQLKGAITRQVNRITREANERTSP
jgi:hypothetical protein